FFQAEDGIRDYKVTGVQTCALPICLDMYLSARVTTSEYFEKEINLELRPITDKCLPPAAQPYDSIEIERDVAYWRKANAIHRWRSEERRVGKEWRSWRWA